VAFEPPAWLRRNWREPEEEAIRASVRNLVLFSPTRTEMAERALEWAMRIVGADTGFIVDADGTLLAAEGISGEQASAVAAEFTGAEGTVRLGDGRTAIAEPLDLSTGPGVLMVVAGPFTPLFGGDEVTRLRAYATFLVAALDRAVLTERLAALERTKTEFLNLASHELRGPLTVLRGYLAMIEAGTLGPIPPQLLEVLPILHAKSNEMNGLVEEMIEAARLEEGRLELHREEVDLRELARRAVDMVRPIADPAHPVVVKQPRHPIRVEVDPDRVVTIVNNLLSNAIKYSPKGGEVRLEVEEDDDHAEVRVKDRGVGIDPEKMDVLFTRFGRIATPETKHISGTGLGLYLSRELARLHGGDLVAESEPGKGSTFVFRVPMTSV
jgi:signal transduction histidine kinase